MNQQQVLHFLRQNKVIFGVYGGVSTLTFGVMAYDKNQAIQRGWRVPEKALHLLEFFGGWPGSFAAQKYLRHKSSKQEYQTVYWSIVGVHVAAFAIGGKTVLAAFRDPKVLRTLLQSFTKNKRF